MTRIISGAAGSLTLKTPGSGTRPTSDRVREAIFSSLVSMDAVEDAAVLDLFAGSGALGLEALSRGAAVLDLVERDPKAAAICRRNAEAVAEACAVPAESVKTHARSVETFLTEYAARPDRRPYDLVLIDPPYLLDEAELSSSLALLVPVVSADAVIVVERSSRAPEPSWPAEFERFRHKKYGETAVWYASA